MPAGGKRRLPFDPGRHRPLSFYLLPEETARV